MLAQGIQLSLLIGPVVPVPVPRAVLDALESVEVSTRTGGASGFQLRFTITARSELNTIFLIGGVTNATPFTPALRVMLIVTMNGQAQPLFDGVMTNVQVQPGGQGQPGSLTVTGEDVTKVMDKQDWSGLPFPAVPLLKSMIPLAAALLILQGIANLIAGCATLLGRERGGNPDLGPGGDGDGDGDGGDRG